MQFGFGVGNLYLIPSGSDPTPIRVGTLMDVSLDFSFTMKELRGQYQFPVDIARAAAKLSGKAKSGAIAAGLINSVLTGSTLTDATYIKVSVDQTGTIPASPGPYTLTPTVPDTVTWSEDLGVYSVDLGKYMTRVASGATPATGEYKVTAGVYTFAAADQADAVLISYTYTKSTTTGKKIVYTNQLMGSGEVYVLHLFNTFRSKHVYVKAHAVTFPKWSIGFKPEDYSESDFDFECFADSSNNVLTWSSAE